MTRAYDEMYLDDAMENLGAAVEYATVLRGMDGQAFLELFVSSGIAAEFGSGNVTLRRSPRGGPQQGGGGVRPDSVTSANRIIIGYLFEINRRKEYETFANAGNH